MERASSVAIAQHSAAKSASKAGVKFAVPVGLAAIGTPPKPRIVASQRQALSRRNGPGIATTNNGAANRM